MMVVMKSRHPEKISKKQQSRDRIVQVTARAIRRRGYDGTGIATIMKEAGLTHGGFYAHFASREVLLAEAAAQASIESIEALQKIVAVAPVGLTLQAAMRAYLSDAHVQNIELGCPIAALGSEIPRQAPEIRHQVTCHLKQMLDLIADQSDVGHEQALVAVATMVGTLLLARATDDPTLAAALTEATLKHYNADQPENADV